MSDYLGIWRHVFVHGDVRICCGKSRALTHPNLLLLMIAIPAVLAKVLRKLPPSRRGAISPAFRKGAPGFCCLAAVNFTTDRSLLTRDMKPRALGAADRLEALLQVAGAVRRSTDASHAQIRA